MTALSVGIRIGSIDICHTLRFARYFFPEPYQLARRELFGPCVGRFGL